MEKYIAIGIIVFIVLVLASVLALCKASGEADRYSAQMMNEDKKDKENLK